MSTISLEMLNIEQGQIDPKVSMVVKHFLQLHVTFIFTNTKVLGPEKQSSLRRSLQQHYLHTNNTDYKADVQNGCNNIAKCLALPRNK